MASLENERYYPASLDETFKALLSAVQTLAKLKSHDEFSKSVVFATKVSGFSWGAQMSAHAMPAEGGAVVRISGSKNIKTNVTAGGAERRNILMLLDATGANIQSARAASATGSAKAGWYPDPDQDDTLRYWDGTVWTDQRRPQ